MPLGAQNVYPAGSNNFFSLLTARLLVLLKNFVEILAVHVRCFLQLFADLFYDLHMIFTLLLVYPFRLSNSGFIRFPGLFIALVGLLIGVLVFFIRLTGGFVSLLDTAVFTQG